MTPRPLDADVVRARLAELVRVCGWLAELGTPDAVLLRDDWRTRLLAERLLQQCVELAVSVNLHVAASLGRPVTGYRESFVAVADLGVLDAALAAELAPSAGLRNVLVHEYLRVDLEVVARAVPAAREQYLRYADAVGRWLGDATKGRADA
ncbi:type VII toxin-antitoxin system HepT family RNase toxin [Aquipuribacter sp. SD81]|uniref:type VII toxin-antitoxin system HepT family RNase toxin n=1 Tax=Aquipuribacter sp. SD81 TaxID=3127703 RepID=UPI003017C5E1